MLNHSPQGPGFLLLFQQDVAHTGDGDRGRGQVDKLRSLIIRQDEEVLEFVQILIMSKIL